ELKIEVNGGVSSNRIAVPFGAVPLFAFGGDFQVRATSSQYRVEIVPGDGGTATIIERQVEGVPVSPREADSAATFVAEWATSVGGNQDDITVPAVTVKAPLQSLGIDQDGRIWLQRAVPDGANSVAD